MYLVEFIDTEDKRRAVELDTVDTTDEISLRFIVKERYNKERIGKQRIQGVKKITNVKEIK